MLALAIGLSAAPAAAYRTLADEYGTGVPVLQPSDSVELFVHGAPPAGIEASDFAAAVQQAAAAWDQDCSRFKFVAAGTTSRARIDGDGISTISVVHDGWEARGYEPDQAAIAELRFVEDAAGWWIADADILINGDTVEWNQPDSPDLRAVLTHELGHCAGLAHSHGADAAGGRCEPDLAAISIMCPQYQSGAWLPREDDLAGICALYPHDPCATLECATGQVCSDGTCVAVPSCPSGERCTNGVCATGGEDAGRCVPAGTFGAPCVRGRECASLLCLTSMDVGSYCTRTCTWDDECPGLQRCTSVEGLSVCAPLPSPSCAMAPTNSREPHQLGILLFLLAAATISRSAARTRND